MGLNMLFSQVTVCHRPLPLSDAEGAENGKVAGCANQVLQSTISHQLRFGYHPLVPESEPATAISAKRKSVFNATYVIPSGYLLLPSDKVKQPAGSPCCHNLLLFRDFRTSSGLTLISDQSALVDRDHVHPRLPGPYAPQPSWPLSYLNQNR